MLLKLSCSHPRGRFRAAESIPVLKSLSALRRGILIVAQGLISQFCQAGFVPTPAPECLQVKMSPLHFRLLQVKFGMVMLAAGLPSSYALERLRKTLGSFLRQVGNRHGSQCQKVVINHTRATHFQAIVALSGERCHFKTVRVMAS